MLNGYIVAVVTPFKNGQLDVKSFEKHINHLITQGISGIVICGSTGESLALSTQEKIELIKIAARVAEGKVKIIASVIDSITNNCLEFMKKTENFVDHFSCACPFYVKPSPDQIFQHFRTLGEATSKGIIIYNNPNRAGVSVDFDTFKRLCAIENIVAIKECSPDLSRFVLWRLQTKKKFSFLAGDDASACGALAMGATGVISVSANVIPNLCVKMYKAFLQQDMERFGILRDTIAPLHRLMFSEPSPAPTKYVLSKLGFMSEEVRAPLTPISQELRAAIDSCMNKMGIV